MSDTGRGNDVTKGLVEARTLQDDVEARQMLASLRHSIAGVDDPYRVGRFVILECVGSGGMGVVYAAYDPKLDRKVAIKVVHPDHRVASGGGDRLFREARALAQISHPNVVQVFDVGEVGDRIFIAMEFVRGPSLREWLGTERRDWSAIVAMYVAAGRGLAAAHALGIVHRDFKPSNVLVDVDGRARVLDFGLARRDVTAGEATTIEARPDGIDPGDHVTRDGQVVGTPAYMAVEQARGESIDARADQFSFCVAMYEALYGRRPYAGTTVAEYVAAGERGLPAKAPTGHDVPGWIYPLLWRGLRPAPDDRFPSMAALLDRLEIRSRAQGRRTWKLAAGLVVISTGIVALGLQSERTEARCAGIDALPDGIWDSAVRDRIRSAFVETDLPYARDAARTVETLLDDHARAWGVARVDVCEATWVRGEQSEAMLDARMACLGRRATELGTLTAVLAVPRTETVQHAVAAVQTLGRLEDCTDGDAPLDARARPTDPTMQAREGEIRDTLVRAATLVAVNQFEDASVVAADAVAAADAIDDASLQGEARRALALAQIGARRWPLAEETLLRALDLAGTAKDGTLAAETMVELVTVAAAQGKYDAAFQWADAAAPMVELFSAGSVVDARRHSHLGSASARGGRARAAVDEHQRALDLLRALYGEEHVYVAGALNGLGLALGGLGRYGEAGDAQRAALAIAEGLLGPDHPRVAELQSNLALTALSLGDYDEAQRGLERGLATLESAYGRDHLAVLRNVSALGLVALRRGDLDAAAATLERAVQVHASRPHDEPWHAAFTLTYLGAVRSAQGDHTGALAAYADAESVFPADRAPTSPIRASLLRERGRTFAALGRVEEGLAELRAALALDEAGAAHDDAAFSLAAIAEVLLAHERLPEAVEAMHRAVAIFDRVEADRVIAARTRAALAALDPSYVAPP